MDKHSSSRYGSIVCVVIIIALMISFATPFGSHINNVTFENSNVALKVRVFEGCTALSTVNFSTSSSLRAFSSYLFSGCTSLTTINYAGTVSQWTSHSGDASWDYETGNYIVYCSDGTVAKDGTVTMN